MRGAYAPHAAKECVGPTPLKPRDTPKPEQGAEPTPLGRLPPHGPTVGSLREDVERFWQAH